MNVLETSKAPAAIGPYSQGYEVNGLVYTSGQIPVDPATGDVPEGISAQARQSCENVGAVLAAAGSDFSKVFKTTCFLADMGDGSGVRKKALSFHTVHDEDSEICKKRNGYFAAVDGLDSDG